MFKKALLASAAVMSAGVASAAVTGNFAITSDYIFRGVSSGQAVQGGLDYSHDSGLYAGTWLSNTGAGGAGDEVDLYVGYGLGLSDGLSLDVGAIQYTSDSQTTTDVTELYVGLAGEAWGATLYAGEMDNATEDNYMYLDLGYSMSTGETTSVDMHVGMFDSSDNAGVDGDIDLSVTYNVGDFGVGLVYQIDDQKAAGNANHEKAQMVVSWGTTFDVK